MIKRRMKLLKQPIKLVLLFLLVLNCAIVVMATDIPNNLQYNGKYYSDYDSIEDVFQAAKDLNGEIVAEGALLLKNDGSLPLNPKQDRLSVFGVRSGDLLEGVNGAVINPNSVDSTASGFRNAGFAVNDVLEKYYKSLTNNQKVEGVEPDVENFTPEIERSFTSFGGAAIIVLQRADAQEDKDFSTSLTGVTSNDNKLPITDMVYGPFSANEATDGPRELQDKIDSNASWGEPYSWNHAHSSVHPSQNAEEDEIADENGNVEVKHDLQLSSSEIALIDYVKEHFDKVVVMFNTSTVFETFNLDRDPQINGIVWFGRPGIQETGITAVAKIVSGEINPSGGASAQWVRDFTADPTWQNASSGRQFRFLDSDIAGDYAVRYENGYYTFSPSSAGRSGLSGIRNVEYEEGIYLGYKYYETVYAELKAGSIKYVKTTDKLVDSSYVLAEGEAWGTPEEWHEYNVVYPFGYGLSYTDFEFDIKGVYKDEKLRNSLGTTVDGDLFSSILGNEADVKQIYIPVKVTNKGGVAGKQAVEIYLTAPYIEGGIEKSYVKLVGFAKTGILLPGKSQTVVVKIDVQDMASFDYNDANNNEFAGWELDPGQYTLRAMSCSSELIAKRQNMYDEVSFVLEDGSKMQLDNVSGNEVTPLFSDPSERSYSIRQGGDQLGQVNANADASMTIMSRGDFIGTFPYAPTVEDLTFKDSAIEYVKQYVQRSNGIWLGFDKDAEDNPWYIPDTLFDVEGPYENWTQASPEDVAARTNGLADVLLYQMAGVPIGGFTMIDGSNFTWDDFLNQLTYAELTSMINGSGTPAIAAVDKAKSTNADRPLNLGSTFTWADEPLQAATFNVDLLHRQGQIVGEFGLQKEANGSSEGQLSGWWGPGANLNRHPFGGRTKEYYSQDGILAGYMGTAAVKGAQEKGVNVYIKHYAFYENEGTHAGTSYWCDEQTMRENVLSSFKRILQESNSSSLMFSAARLGIEQFANSYAFLTDLTRKEWGWYGEAASDMVLGQNSTAWVNPQVPAAPEGETRTTMYDWPAGNFNNTEIMLRAGLGMPMRGPVPQGTWITDARDGKGSVVVYPVEFAANKPYAIGDYIKVTTDGVPTYYQFIANHTPGAFDALQVEVIDSAQVFDTFESLQQWYYVRQTALTGFYQAANSKIIQNGVQTRLFKAQEVQMTQGVVVDHPSPLTTEDLNGGSAVYTIQSGTLPDGLTLNPTTGLISGTPTQILTSNVNVTIQLTVDRWVRARAIYTFTSVSSWTAPTATAEVGTVYNGSVLSNISGGSGAVSYTIITGSLPAGLTLNTETGAITGTPTHPGEYMFIVEYKRGTGSAFVSQEFTITVTGTAAAPTAPAGMIVAINKNETGGFTVTYENGYEDTIDMLGIPEEDIQDLIDAAVDGLLNTAQVNALITAATDGFLNTTQVNALITSATSGLLNATQVDALITAATSGLLNTTQVQTLINASIETKLTAAEVQEIVDAAVSDKLSETQVQALIDAALTVENTGCGSSIRPISLLSFVVIGVFSIAIFGIKRRKANLN